MRSSRGFAVKPRMVRWVRRQSAMIGQPADFPQPESPDSPSRSCKRVPRSTSEPRRRDKLTEPRASSVRQRNLRRTEPARRRRSASSAVTSHRSLPWTSSMDFFHGFLPWTSSTDFFQGPLPRILSMIPSVGSSCWLPSRRRARRTCVDGRERCLSSTFVPPQAPVLRPKTAPKGSERPRKVPKGSVRYRKVFGSPNQTRS